MSLSESNTDTDKRFSWKKIKLADGPSNDRFAYSIENCLSNLLPEITYSKKKNEWVRNLIKARFKERFIRPLDALTKLSARNEDDEYVAVGFTTMAIASLMIETLACFRYGQWDTYLKKEDLRFIGDHQKKWKNSRQIFESFLEDRSNAFNVGKNLLFDVGEGKKFYLDVRCGILHQGETKSAWRIWQKGPAIKRNPNIINAPKFFRYLKEELDRYLKDLSKNNDKALWKSCRYKLLGICANSGWDKKLHTTSRKEIEWSAYW